MHTTGAITHKRLTLILKELGHNAESGGGGGSMMLEFFLCVGVVIVVCRLGALTFSLTADVAVEKCGAY